MKNLKRQFYSKNCNFVQQVIFAFSFICYLLVIVSCNESDNRMETEPPFFSEEDVRHEEKLNFYLYNDYTCHIHSVSITESSVRVTGEYTGEGNFFLGEITPSMDVAELKNSPYKVKLVNSLFQIELERFVEREGFLYDRLLSKWAIFKEEAGQNLLVSHARYADEIFATQHLAPIKIVSKKGMGGIIPNQYISDFASLNISSATINVCITHFMHLTPRTGDVEYVYGGKSYYMDLGYLENSIDRTLLAATKERNMSVAAIILLEPASRCIDSQLGEILQHPDNDGGVYTMPNMTTLEGLNCYAAALDFLAQRYSDPDMRIAHWIIHNEVDGGIHWTNMGDKPIATFMDTYLRSMRMCYNIVHQYDQHSEVFISFSHGWNIAAGGGWYKVRDMLDLMNLFSKAEGDFFWSLACHSYPAQLGNPCTWDDAQATFSMDTEYVTLKNLEVLDKWVGISQNQYKGNIRRSVWLSEAGTCSPSYEDKDLQDQAAGFAYGWKKINALDGINGIQWHSWFDHLGDGVPLGLRKYSDEEYKGEAKPVWTTYQKAGTDEEDDYFKQYLERIGIKSWEGLIQDIP
ncbi:DUF5722 domain-containing protein [Bacteroides caccae]|uniref:DUF5722 domain-containing protein n=1 Tax=Bacteroides caccae TaxID=47678 RepID=UPI001EE9751A|nr:DUF5722 domain-containing protein [Bacteroides caccae]